MGEPNPGDPGSPSPVYATAGLVDAVLDLAAQNEPQSLTVGIRTTSSADLDGDPDLPGDVPVFTHFYLPNTALPNRSVFGVDLSIPLGHTDGVFVSHPVSKLDVSERDDLHRVVIVAVPPWDRDSVAAFDRAGRRHPLRVVSGDPPTESLPGLPE